MTGEAVGTYTINKGSVALNANYTLTYVSANLTISTKQVPVTAVAKTKVYGSSDPVRTSTSNALLLDGDTFTGTLSRSAG